jgi:hypothetical protein
VISALGIDSGPMTADSEMIHLHSKHPDRRITHQRRSRRLDEAADTNHSSQFLAPECFSGLAKEIRDPENESEMDWTNSCGKRPLRAFAPVSVRAYIILIGPFLSFKLKASSLRSSNYADRGDPRSTVAASAEGRTERVRRGLKCPAFHKIRNR